MKKILLSTLTLVVIGFGLSSTVAHAGGSCGQLSMPYCPNGGAAICVCPSNPTALNPCEWRCV